MSEKTISLKSVSNDSVVGHAPNVMEHDLSDAFNIRNCTINELILYIKKLKLKNSLSFKEFIKSNYYKSCNKPLICKITDFEISPHHIPSDNKSTLDLPAADFSECIFENVTFKNCNLDNAKFQNVEFKEVFIFDSNISNIDLRGADLEGLFISPKYEDKALLANKSNIIFSVPYSVIRIFADIKNEISRKNLEQKTLDDARAQFHALSAKIDNFTKIKHFFGFKINNAQYAKLHNDISKMEKGFFPKDSIINNSIKYIIDESNYIYDPLFTNIETAEFDPRKRRNINFSRKDLEAFSQQKSNIIKSLIDYALLLKFEGQNNLRKKMNIGVNIASKVNIFGSNEWNRLNLGGIEFRDLNLSYTDFSGSDLSKCSFINCELKGSVFYCSKLVECNFRGSNLSECKFTNADLESSSFNSCKLNNVCFDYAKLSYCHFTESKLTSVKAKKTKCNNLILSKSEILNTNFSCSDFTKARLNDCLLRNCDFNKSKWSHAKIVKVNIVQSNFSYSDFIETTISDSNFKKSIFTSAKIEECEVLKNTSFEETSFLKSSFIGTAFETAKFINCMMCNSKNIFTYYNNSDFYNCNISFTKFFNTRFDYSVLKDINLSNSYLFNITFKDSNAANCNWRASSITSSHFQSCNSKEDDFRDVKCVDSYFIRCDINKMQINIMSDIKNNEFSNINEDLIYHKSVGGEKKITFKEFLKIKNRIHKNKNFDINNPFVKSIIQYLHQAWRFFFSKDNLSKSHIQTIQANNKYKLRLLEENNLLAEKIQGNEKLINLFTRINTLK